MTLEKHVSSDIIGIFFLLKIKYFSTNLNSIEQNLPSKKRLFSHHIQRNPIGGLIHLVNYGLIFIYLFSCRTSRLYSIEE